MSCHRARLTRAPAHARTRRCIGRCRTWPPRTPAPSLSPTPGRLHVSYQVKYSEVYFAFSALTAVGWRQEGHPACKKTEWWGVGVVICLERGADLHMAQLMPLSLTVSCFSKIQTGFTFLVPADQGSPRKMAVKRVCAYNDLHNSRLLEISVGAISPALTHCPFPPFSSFALSLPSFPSPLSHPFLILPLQFPLPSFPPRKSN